jgi:hypothetical protein
LLLWGLGEQAAAEVECWVMVYGLAAEHQSTVLGELQRCAEVVGVKHPSRGNWLAVQFANPHGAQAAVGRDGMELSAGVLVGVRPMDAQRLASLKSDAAYSAVPSVSARAAPATPTMVVRPYHLDSAAAAAIPQPNRSTWNKVVHYVFGL